MGFSLESRRLIVEKMDKQFASDLDTRRKSNIVKKRASGKLIYIIMHRDIHDINTENLTGKCLRYLWKFGFASKGISELRYGHL